MTKKKKSKKRTQSREEIVRHGERVETAMLKNQVEHR